MSNFEFASAGLTAGQLNAIVKKLGGPEAALSFLRADSTISEPACKWREVDEVIYFSVTSDGTTGKDWIPRLEGKGFRISIYAEKLLLSDDFKPTAGITSEIAVLKGVLFGDGERTTKNIDAEASRRKLSKLDVEVACLIREKFTDSDIEKMRLMYIIAMHEPIDVSDNGPSLLRVFRGGAGSWLDALPADPSGRWGRTCGSAFVVSQINT